MKKKIPIDIRRIRQALGLTMSEMGTFISTYTYGIGGVPIPATRINEWEMGVRPTPSHVFTASAKLLLDIWSEDRHRAPVENKSAVDVFFGTILCPPLGEVFRLEAQLHRTGTLDTQELERRVAKIRKAQLDLLETQLNVKTGYVFDTELR